MSERSRAGARKQLNAAKRASNERSTLHRAAVNTTPAHDVPSSVHDTLHSPGQPLDAGTRAFMEPHFGHDFSGVRVHTDKQASESANAVNARAYTVGKNVVFGAGQYAPGTMRGRELLAHELTHVVQQMQGQAAATPVTDPIAINELGDTYEQEADSVARVLTAPSEPGIVSKKKGGTGNHGNMSAIQRNTGNSGALTLQRKSPDAPYKQLDVLNPETIRKAVEKVITDEEAPVVKWLDSNTVRLNVLSKDQIVFEVQQNVPQASKLAPAQIQMLVEQWAIRNHIALKEPKAGQVSAYKEIASRIASVLSIANDGVKITPSPVEVQISVTGATATLKADAVDIEASLGLDRKIGLKASYGPYQFAVELSGKQWKLTFSYGSDDVPDLDGLVKTFKEGENSLRQVASDPTSLRNPDTAKNVREAGESLKNIITSAAKHVEVSVSSIDDKSGGKQGGWEAKVTVTLLRF
jgi:hypothetical protein